MLVHPYGMHHSSYTIYFLFLEGYGENSNTVIAGIDADLQEAYVVFALQPIKLSGIDIFHLIWLVQA
jgi:hypothetical protein